MSSSNSATAKSATNEYDIAIVGGAMAGACLALAAAKLVKLDGERLKIALIEAKPPGDAHPGFDARAIALNAGTVKQLQLWGLWSDIAPLATPIHDIHVSDRYHLGTTDLHARDYHVDALGQVVELERVGPLLHRLLEASPVQLFCPLEVKNIDSHENGHDLQLSDNSQLRCNLLVGADGLNSMVRQHWQLAPTQEDFGQSAIIANIRCEQPHQGRAFERFTEHGPIALLPMSEQRMSLVWAMDSDAQKQVLAKDDEAFIKALQQAFGYRLGRITETGKRSGYPLKLTYLPRVIHHRTVLVGNAAQTLHPIAGQGFNLGLRDVATLVTCLRTHLSTANDCGDNALCHAYLEARQVDRQLMIESIELLVRGFSNNHLPLVVGRNIALKLLNWISPLRAGVARQAMGWHHSFDKGNMS
ncbi:2-octaprenyl-6-methoxyphenyl hydroxylase [Paraferrimonas haliotis]|uniref:2-octaprenyl-6-methoxyphenyl hydroxylase n=1 Tax=Paraferrimonas haliotis TaxID=2013866 RepID=UPI000BA9505A|nr:2-octaprenyl-6-methoxyphenyl hydroxylase [Paraferrimonas haliotis]